MVTDLFRETTSIVDPQNPIYEDLPGDITDEDNQDEFEENEDPNDESSYGSDNEWISLCHFS